MSSFMDDSTKSICASMKNDPNRWQITTYTVDDCSSGIKYWLGAYTDPITEIWNGYSRDVVFNKNQGTLIRNAFSEMKNISRRWHKIESLNLWNLSLRLFTLK